MFLYYLYILFCEFSTKGFLARLSNSTGSYCCHSDVDVGVGDTLQSFMLKFFKLSYLKNHRPETIDI